MSHYTKATKTKLTIRCLLFLLKHEKFKESVVTRSIRYDYVFVNYYKYGIPKAFIIFVIRYAPAIWLILSVLVRVTFKTDRLIAVSNDSSVLLDHTSKKYQKTFATNHSEFRLQSIDLQVNWTQLFVSLPTFVYIFKKLLEKDQSYNPEIAAAFFSSFICTENFLVSNRGFSRITVNDDFMPKDLGMLAAFKVHNKEVNAFRVNEAASRVKSPIWLNKLFCLSRTQTHEFARAKKYEVVESNASKVLVPIPKSNILVIGHPLTAKFDAKSIWSVLSQVKSSLPIQFNLRPHPASRVEEVIRAFKDIDGVQTASINITDPADALSQFNQSVDICIGGNSSACKDLLNFGTAILYRDDLDFAEQDAHGWLQLGLFYDFRNEYYIDMAEVQKFFNDFNSRAIYRAQ